MSKTKKSAAQAERERKAKLKQEQQAARETAKAEQIELLKLEVTENDEGMRSIGEHLLKALHYGATQREVAEAVDKSVAWVNRIKKWADAGYAACGAFSTESKAKRQRARVQAPEQKQPGIGHNKPPADKPAASVTGSADTDVNTEAREARNAALAGEAQAPADDLTVPPFMRRASPTAATLNGSGALVAEALSLPDDDYRLELKDKLHHVFDDVEMLLQDKSAWAHLTKANQKKLFGAVEKLRKLREELLSISRNCFPVSRS